MNNGDVITFDAKKNFKYIKPLGSGGTGDTHLFKDETTDTLFAIKKYVPKDKRFIDENYKRFVDEIKILFNISHPNIVRIYNYYLYPQFKTGYLQMEYIDGTTIDKFDPEDSITTDWDHIFTNVISAFEYLEQNHILHRDIRPQNILLDINENVKIIDFGFGKQFDVLEQDENSVCLNWPATEMPDEVISKQEYNEQTEIYFVGTLFKHLIKERLEDFRFFHIIEKMTKSNQLQRYKSFNEIANDISLGVISEINFSDKEKKVYRNFATELESKIVNYIDKYIPLNNSSVTIARLAELIIKSSLEEKIQDNGDLIDCFIGGRYKYSVVRSISISLVEDFYKLAISLSPSKQKILFDNVYTRLSLIDVEIDEEEVPF